MINFENPYLVLSGRVVGIASGLIGGVFWIYTFFEIAKLPEGDGSGFQWMAEGPLATIFIFFSFPAIALAASRARPRPYMSALLGLSGLAAFAYVWPQILAEM